MDVFDFLPVWKLTYRLLLGIFLFVGISIAIFLLTLDYFFRRFFSFLNTHWFSCESNLLSQHIVALKFSSLIWEFKKKDTVVLIYLFTCWIFSDGWNNLARYQCMLVANFNVVIKFLWKLFSITRFIEFKNALVIVCNSYFSSNFVLI